MLSPKCRIERKMLLQNRNLFIILFSNIFSFFSLQLKFITFNDWLSFFEIQERIKQKNKINFFNKNVQFTEINIGQCWMLSRRPGTDRRSKPKFIQVAKRWLGIFVNQNYFFQFLTYFWHLPIQLFLFKNLKRITNNEISK